MIDLWFDLIVKATILCLAAAILTIAMRRASAASRHLVWTGLFIAVLALPIARLLLPTLPVFVLAAPVQPREAPQPVEVRLSEPISMAPAVPPMDVPPLALPPDAPAWEPIARASITIGDVVPVLWFAGFLILLARIGIGARRIRQLDRQALPVVDAWVLARASQLKARFRIRRSIALRSSADDGMPMTWGVMRPVILLPARALQSTDQADGVVEAMLVHEVAHVARLDAVSAAVARFVVAAGWFHPLLWLAARQARLERERACDDAVLAGGLRPSAYASQLLALAQASAPGLTGASQTLAMARQSQLEQRVRSILNARANRRSASRLSRWIAAALVVAAVPGAAVQLAARAPELTDDSRNGFRESIPGVVSETTTAIAPVPRRASAAASPAVQTPVVQNDINAQATNGVVQTVEVQAVQNSGACTTPDPFVSLGGGRCVNGGWLPGLAPQPAVPTYVIGTNDLLTVTVWRAPEVSGDVRVQPDGTIRLSMGNDIRAAGHTLDQVRANIRTELTRFYTQPDVLVQVKQVNSALTPVPATPPTYVIGADDLLRITVVGVPELTGDVRMGADGKIRLARGNPIAAAGWTASGVKDAITAELKRCCLPAPEVLVQISQINRGHSFFFFNGPPPPGQTMQSLTGVARDNEWDFMVKTLRDRSVKADLDIAVTIEIGTAVPIDRVEFQRVKQALDALAPWSHAPTAADLFELRARFTNATRNLDGVEIRFRNGMVPIRELADAYIAVVNALKEPPPGLVTSVPLSDADLLIALRTAALLQPDSARATRLLDLAQRYAFTPEMVTLYVAAANGIGSETERTRVFAQQIRIKGK